MRFSPEALKARMERMGEGAAAIIETVVGQEDIICPNCQAIIHAAKVDRLAVDTAFKVLASIGLGPVERHRKEEAIPTSPRELLTALADRIETLPLAEREVLLRRLAGAQEALTDGGQTWGQEPQ